MLYIYMKCVPRHQWLQRLPLSEITSPLCRVTRVWWASCGPTLNSIWILHQCIFSCSAWLWQYINTQIRFAPYHLATFSWWHQSHPNQISGVTAFLCGKITYISQLIIQDAARTEKKEKKSKTRLIYTATENKCSIRVYYLLPAVIISYRNVNLTVFRCLTSILYAYAEIAELSLSLLQHHVS